MNTKYCLICGEQHSRYECPPLQACSDCGNAFYSYEPGVCYECGLTALSIAVSAQILPPEIETCQECGEYHERKECTPLQTCECGKQFRSYLVTKCMPCVLRDLPEVIQKITFGGSFAQQHAAPPKRQTVPDAFYRAFK